MKRSTRTLPTVAWGLAAIGIAGSIAAAVWSAGSFTSSSRFLACRTLGIACARAHDGSAAPTPAGGRGAAPTGRPTEAVAPPAVATVVPTTFESTTRSVALAVVRPSPPSTSRHSGQTPPRGRPTPPRGRPTPPQGRPTPPRTHHSSPIGPPEGVVAAIVQVPTRPGSGPSEGHHGLSPYVVLLPGAEPSDARAPAGPPSGRPGPPAGRPGPPAGRPGSRPASGRPLGPEGIGAGGIHTPVLPGVAGGLGPAGGRGAR